MKLPGWGKKRNRGEDGTGADAAPGTIWDDEAPEFNPPRPGKPEAPADGVFSPPRSSSKAVPRYAPVRRDFFEMRPEEVETWKAPGGTLDASRKLNLAPALYVASALAGLGLIVAAVWMLWPSSTVKVPGLEGRQLYDAIEAARGSSLEPVVEGFENSNRYADGVVMSQEPAAGTVKKKGGRVSLTVSKGPSGWAEGAEPGARLTPPAPPGAEDGGVSAGPLSSRTVCIDPGGQAGVQAGEWADPGLTARENPQPVVRGVSTGNPEYLLTMDIALRLRTLLEKDGMKVVMTRESQDAELTGATKAEMASEAGADLLVSVRMGNSGTDPAVTGSYCLYPEKNRWTAGFYESSKAAALFVVEALSKACGTKDLGVEPGGDMALFNWSKAPVFEARVAYLSNPSDDEELSGVEFRQQAAWGLRDGIVRYFRSP
ncbi:MAG: N-acetylmuramoyl-L-alanine amidase [Gemmatimonadetes bacterium]|nr:N-acetylmuramoyl-L-alanine amidase [Gemmatimonadota bacterium]